MKIIGVEDLHIFEAPREPHWKSLKELEKDYIEEVLEYTGGDIEKAAHVLGISPKNWRKERLRQWLQIPRTYYPEN